MIKVPSHKIPIEILFETLNCINQEKKLDINNLHLFINASKSYAQSSLATLKMVNCFLDEDYILKPRIKELLKKYSSKFQAKELFKEILLLWEPFIIYLSYLNGGYTKEQSISKLSYFYTIDKTSFLLEIFTKWINDLQIKIDSDLANYKDENIDKILDIKFGNEVYFCNSLTEEVYNFLDDDIKSNLRKAIEKSNKDPKSSINYAGQAFEDFLRLIGKEKCIDIKKASGIGQISNQLYCANLLHSKHNNICVALSDIRNMAGHSKEKDTMQSWKLTNKASILYINQLLVAITSIYFSAIKSLQVY